jgi:hypothetical protein
MGRRLIEVYPSRALVLGGAAMLGVFGIVAFVLQRADAGDDALSVVGGVLAYGFIAFAALVGYLAWKGTPRRRAHQVAERFLADSEVVGRVVGKPVDVRLRPSRTREIDGSHLEIVGEVGGQLAQADVSATVAPEGDTWRVVDGRVAADDRTLPLV